MKFDFVSQSIQSVNDIINNSLVELQQLLETNKEKKEEEKRKNIIPQNSIEKMAEKKLNNMAKNLIERASVMK
jgi:hypothetical protein